VVIVRMSLCLDPARPWAEARELARVVDAAGWYAVYQCDHFMPHDGSGRSVDGPVTECWTTLSALATTTSRLRLGSLVLGATYRHPAVVASMAATLDRISGGRVVLGVGAGWQPNEHRAFGIPLPDPRPRLEALDETCAVLRSLLDDGRSSFQGTAFLLDDARCEPGPVQARLPLLVGGGGEQRTMRVAARWADVWHTWADPATFARKNAVLDERCGEIGRDPRTVARATGAGVALDVGGAVPQGRELEGTPAEVLARLRDYRRAGADEFVVRDHGVDPVPLVREQIEGLTRHVVPGLED
jgi:F420-dependent oxidoreductase-like protein